MSVQAHAPYEHPGYDFPKLIANIDNITRSLPNEMPGDGVGAGPVNRIVRAASHGL